MPIRRPNWFRTKPETIIAVAATFVSLCALCTTMYQTYILQQQQHAAVWPRLELYHAWIRNVDKPYYRLQLRNVGIGPAIIRQVSIQYQGKSFQTFAELANAVARQHGLADSAAYQDYSDLFPDMVVPQQENTILLYVDQEPYLQHFTEALEKIDVKVQYESLYGDAWEIVYPKSKHQPSHRKVD